MYLKWRSMPALLAAALAVLVLWGGFAYAEDPAGGPELPPGEAAMPPLESPPPLAEATRRGPVDAPVQIVVFSDFQ